MPPLPMPQRRSAFTLVELLVVIGIIAVLIALLLPVLSRVRRHTDTLKCASNLRQIGLAFQLYARDHKGAWPVSYFRVPDGAPNRYRYQSDPENSPLSRPWYWHMFLQPYLGNSIRDIDSAKNPRYIQENPVLWGCPEWRPWEATTPALKTAFNGDFNPEEVGYGMNWSPTYRADFPSESDWERPKLAVENSWGGSMISTSWENRAYHNTWNGTRRPGRFFKATEYTRPEQRGLVCDAEYFNVKMDIPPESNGRPWPQPVHIYDVYGQHNMDFFRHGKPAKPQKGNPNFLDMSTGTPANNMLFCDGHVETLRTYGDIYKALRMRYPG